MLVKAPSDLLFWDSEEEEFIGEDALEFEEALAAPEDLRADPFYFVRAYTASRGDIWHASRVGDVGRVRFTAFSSTKAP